MVVIDAHTHFADVGKGSPPNTPEALIEVMKINRLDAMVTMPPYSYISFERDYDEPNTFIHEAMKKYPKRIFGFARINPHHREKALKQAETAITDWGFKGFKLDPTHEAYGLYPGSVEGVMELARRLQVPVYFHTGDSIFCPPLRTVQ